METETSGTQVQTQDYPGRYHHLDRILTRSGPFTDPDFNPGAETQDFLRNKCKVLVIGKFQYFYKELSLLQEVFKGKNSLLNRKITR